MANIRAVKKNGKFFCTASPPVLARTKRAGKSDDTEHGRYRKAYLRFVQKELRSEPQTNGRNH